MRRKRIVRKWDDAQDEDPGAGLLNLFDVWIAFAVALLLATLSYSKAATDASKQAATENSHDPVPSLAELEKNKVKIERFRPSDAKLSGEGQRLGTAYRLKNGEVVYVPEKSE